MERLICLVIGYAFGIVQTGYLYGKTQNVDIRQYGSGNAGTTNVLRTLGWKAGAITFVGDSFKCILAVLLVKILFGTAHADNISVLFMYTGMGAVLGHNYPFYMKFKGGKGIAVTAGLIASTTNIWITLICLVTFASVVFITRYVSLGSMIVVSVYFICVVVYGQMGGYIYTGSGLIEIYVIGFLLVVSAFYKHKANIKRLRTGTENKLSVGKR